MTHERQTQPKTIERFGHAAGVVDADEFSVPQVIGRFGVPKLFNVAWRSIKDRPCHTGFLGNQIGFTGTDHLWVNRCP